ncbi:MAG TPA: MFS transporter [Sphingomonadaceae bacterium]|nr:MFS transporter [Sphingomonadaceae bacterium]
MRRTEQDDTGEGYPYWLMFMLLLVALSSFIDRVIVATLGPGIKADLGITDTQFGLLTGLAFALLYTSAGIPVARLADRYNRINLLTISIAIWSVMTVLSGAAVNFVQLLLLRLGVGVGEAAANPSTISLLSDRFPRNRRASALAVVAMGASLGSLVGGFGGGWLGEHLGWRAAFVIVGAPGLVLALLIFLTLRELPRGRYDEGRKFSADTPSFGTLLRTIRSKPAFLHMAMACGLTSFVNFGVLLFLPLYFGRAYGMGMAQAGLLFGLVTSISNGLGTLFGGFGADWAAKRDERWYAWLPALCLVVTAPFYMFGLTLPDWRIALPIVGCAAILAFTFYAPTFGAIQNMVEPRMRASASAILIFFQNLVGMGLGPLFVGYMSDRYAAHLFTAGDHAAVCVGQAAVTLPDCASAGANGIRYAMVTCAAFLFWAALHYWLASRTLRRDMA